MSNTRIVDKPLKQWVTNQEHREHTRTVEQTKATKTEGNKGSD